MQGDEHQLRCGHVVRFTDRTYCADNCVNPRIVPPGEKIFYECRLCRIEQDMELMYVFANWMLRTDLALETLEYSAPTQEMEDHYENLRESIREVSPHFHNPYYL